MERKTFDIQIAIEKIGWNEELKNQYENLKRLRKEGILFADSKCHKLHTGEVPWSKTLQKARDEIELWNNEVSRKKGIK